MTAPLNPRQPLRVRRVVVEGNLATRESTVANRFREALAANNVAELGEGVVLGTRRLWDLNIFETLDVQLRPAGGGGSSRRGEGAGTNDDDDDELMVNAEILVRVKEKRLLSGKATTFVAPQGGSGGGGVEFAGKLANSLGLAESVQVSYSTSGSAASGNATTTTDDGVFREGGGSISKHVPHLLEANRTTFAIDFALPQPLNLNAFTLHLGADQTSNRPPGGETAPFQELSYGISARLVSKSLQFVYESRERDVLPRRGHDAFTYDAPPALVRMAKPSMKSSLAVEYLAQPAMELGTLNYKARVELANSRLLGGDVDALFLSGLMRRVVPLDARGAVALSLSMEGSIVRPMGELKEVHLTDRLHMGGPLGLRGFVPRGAGGERAQAVSLGGDTHWQTRVALESPLREALRVGRAWLRPGQTTTTMASDPVGPDVAYTHAFLTMGSLMNFSSPTSLPVNNPNWLGELIYGQARASCGLGLIIPVGEAARVELSAVFPLRWRKGGGGDYFPGGRVGPRFEIGFGGEFL